MTKPYTTEQGKRMLNRFRIYQDINEVFYIEDILHYDKQTVTPSYKIGHEEDVNYEDILKIVDLLNAQNEVIKLLLLQCKDFKEMIDDLNIPYLLREGISEELFE